MLDDSFVEAIAELARGRAQTEEFHGLPYSNQTLKPVLPPMPAFTYTSTLQSIVDYLHRNPDAHEMPHLLVCVVSPSEVLVCSALENTSRLREGYLLVRPLLPEFKFDAYHSQERFLIMLQTRFEINEDRDYLQQLLGNLTAEQSLAQLDDGLSQQVTAKTGIAKVGNVALRPLVQLRPFRTYTEVAQPASTFLVRLKGDVEGGCGIALFEADGGAWRMEAIAAVRAWLEDHLAEEIAAGVTVLA